MWLRTGVIGSNALCGIVSSIFIIVRFISLASFIETSAFGILGTRSFVSVFVMIFSVVNWFPSSKLIVIRVYHSKSCPCESKTYSIALCV